MIILVDIGNTRVKLARLADGEVTAFHEQIHYANPAQVLQELLVKVCPKSRLIDSIWIASVHDEKLQKELDSILQTRFQTELHWVISPAQGGGVTNGYRDPERLGVDRFLAMVGARTLTAHPVCVVDCGTAVTVDYLDGQGVHQGGAIAPGLQLMRKALQQGAVRLAQEPAPEVALLADNTAAAMASGTTHSIVGLIEHTLATIARMTGGMPELLLTGGDAEHIAPLLIEPSQISNDLVIRGLAVMAGEKV